MKDRVFNNGFKPHNWIKINKENIPVAIGYENSGISVSLETLVSAHECSTCGILKLDFVPNYLRSIESNQIKSSSDTVMSTTYITRNKDKVGQIILDYHDDCNITAIQIVMDG